MQHTCACHLPCSSQSRLDRMFCRLADWQPLAIEMVGQEPIAGLTRTVSWRVGISWGKEVCCSADGGAGANRRPDAHGRQGGVTWAG